MMNYQYHYWPSFDMWWPWLPTTATPTTLQSVSTWVLWCQLSLIARPSEQDNNVSDQCWGGDHSSCLGDSKCQEIHQEMSGGRTRAVHTEEEAAGVDRERVWPALYKPGGPEFLFLHLHQRSQQTSPRLGHQERPGRQFEGGLHRGHHWLDYRYRGYQEIRPSTLLGVWSGGGL